MTLKKGLLVAGERMAGLAGAMFLPMSEKQKNAYIEWIEERRDFYQPRIEEKTGVQLGKVYVLPNMIWAYQEIDRMYSRLCTFPLEDYSQKKISRFEKEVLSWGLPVVALPPVALIGSALVGYSKFSDNTMSLAAGEDCIRVPFGFSTRMNLWRKNIGTKDSLDEAVVHELSHILSFRLEEKNKPAHICPHELSEGFATYCHEEYFADIYPEGYVVDKELVGGVYKSGKEKIEQLVAKHGEEILLQIPTKWPELLKEK
ncbi:MAG: hypothetical protein WCI72_04685 [archaeon]